MIFHFPLMLWLLYKETISALLESIIILCDTHTGLFLPRCLKIQLSKVIMNNENLLLHVSMIFISKLIMKTGERG